MLRARQRRQEPQVVRQSVAFGEGSQTRGARLKRVALRQQQERYFARRRLDGPGLNNINFGHFVPLLTSLYQPGSLCFAQMRVRVSRLMPLAVILIPAR